MSIWTMNGSHGELLIYDYIGETFLGEGITARRVQALLASAEGQLTELTVRINSPGGSVYDGAAIYNLLHQNPARIIIDVEGMALSAASEICMAGDEIRMAANALMMIHGAWGVTQGDARDHEAQAITLRKMTEAAAAVYSARTGIPVDKIMKLLDAETWFTADEAVAQGFATEVRPAKTPPPPQQAWRGLEKKLFKHPPAELRGLIEREAPKQSPRIAPRAPMQPAQLRGLARLAGERKRTLGDV